MARVGRNHEQPCNGLFIKEVLVPCHDYCLSRYALLKTDAAQMQQPHSLVTLCTSQQGHMADVCHPLLLLRALIEQPLDVNAGGFASAAG